MTIEYEEGKSKRQQDIERAIRRNKMKTIRGFVILFLIGVLAFGGMYVFFNKDSMLPSGYDPIVVAETLTEGGFHLYHVSWCPHCQNQLKLFGNDALEYLNNTECDTIPNDHPEKEMCDSIPYWPTWKLPDGELTSGYKNFAELEFLYEDCTVDGCNMDYLTGNEVAVVSKSGSQ